MDFGTTTRNFDATSNIASFIEDPSEAYTRIKVLGKGAYGEAILVERKSDKKKYVIKEVRATHMSEDELKKAQQEAEVLRKMAHSNIISCVESFVTAGEREGEMGKYCIVTEFADRGDLSEHIKVQKRDFGYFEEREVMSIFVQLCRALKHVHNLNILHRDLKSQNVFLATCPQEMNHDRISSPVKPAVNSDGQSLPRLPVMVKLGDFGIAKVMSNTLSMAETQIGTPYYLSPEIYEDQAYGKKSDMWSVGVLLHEVAALELPFHAKNIIALSRKVLCDAPNRLPIDELNNTNVYSDELQELVDSLLNKDPALRPSADEVLRNSLAVSRFTQSADGDDLSYTLLTQQLPKKFNSLAGVNEEERAIQKGNQTLQKEDNKPVMHNERSEESKSSNRHHDQYDDFDDFDDVNNHNVHSNVHSKYDQRKDQVYKDDRYTSSEYNEQYGRGATSSEQPARVHEIEIENKQNAYLDNGYNNRHQRHEDGGNKARQAGYLSEAKWNDDDNNDKNTIDRQHEQLQREKERQEEYQKHTSRITNHKKVDLWRDDTSNKNVDHKSSSSVTASSESSVGRRRRNQWGQQGSKEGGGGGDFMNQKNNTSNYNSNNPSSTVFTNRSPNEFKSQFSNDTYSRGNGGGASRELSHHHNHRSNESKNKHGSLEYSENGLSRLTNAAQQQQQQQFIYQGDVREGRSRGSDGRYHGNEIDIRRDYRENRQAALLFKERYESENTQFSYLSRENTKYQGKGNGKGQELVSYKGSHRGKQTGQEGKARERYEHGSIGAEFHALQADDSKQQGTMMSIARQDFIANREARLLAKARAEEDLYGKKQLVFDDKPTYDSNRGRGGGGGGYGYGFDKESSRQYSEFKQDKLDAVDHREAVLARGEHERERKRQEHERMLQEAAEAHKRDLQMMEEKRKHYDDAINETPKLPKVVTGGGGGGGRGNKEAVCIQIDWRTIDADLEKSNADQNAENDDDLAHFEKLERDRKKKWNAPVLSSQRGGLEKERKGSRRGSASSNDSDISPIKVGNSRGGRRSGQNQSRNSDSAVTSTAVIVPKRGRRVRKKWEVDTSNSREEHGEGDDREEMSNITTTATTKDGQMQQELRANQKKEESTDQSTCVILKKDNDAVIRPSSGNNRLSRDRLRPRTAEEENRHKSIEQILEQVDDVRSSFSNIRPYSHITPPKPMDPRERSLLANQNTHSRPLSSPAERAAFLTSSKDSSLIGAKYNNESGVGGEGDDGGDMGPAPSITQAELSLTMVKELASTGQSVMSNYEDDL